MLYPRLYFRRALVNQLLNSAAAAKMIWCCCRAVLVGLSCAAAFIPTPRLLAPLSKSASHTLCSSTQTSSSGFACSQTLPKEALWMDSFATPVPAATAGAKWRNVRNVPGTLRHLLNPDSPAYRPDLKSQWDSMSKTQRDLVIQWQAAHTMEAKQHQAVSASAGQEQCDSQPVESAGLEKVWARFDSIAKRFGEKFGV